MTKVVDIIVLKNFGVVVLWFNVWNLISTGMCYSMFEMIYTAHANLYKGYSSTNIL